MKEAKQLENKQQDELMAKF
jgi:hypothetical protein